MRTRFDETQHARHADGTFAAMHRSAPAAQLTAPAWAAAAYPPRIDDARAAAGRAKARQMAREAWRNDVEERVAEAWLREHRRHLMPGESMPHRHRGVSAVAYREAVHEWVMRGGGQIQPVPHVAVARLRAAEAAANTERWASTALPDPIYTQPESVAPARPATKRAGVVSRVMDWFGLS